MPKLILWDVDATLLSTDGIGGDVMRTAMAQVFGPSTPRGRTFYSGKTDRQIIHDTFPDVTPAALVEKLERFSSTYVAEFERRYDELRARTTTMPGVAALIEHIHTYFQGRILQAPLTGNIAPIARRKLDLIGLLPYFDLAAGAYGDDHEDRTQLVPIAAGRASLQTGGSLRGCDIVVVGDTPHDIRCGRRNGTRTVAVATGPYSVEDLRAHEPDAVLADLSDFEMARAAILGEG